ncbi:hypothetical protein [Catenulispora subtropica]|uniref:hypothetical protein n=1 Tax=Catenulispora subtropica TaxID=450798 RepID=UPI0031DED57E
MVRLNGRTYYSPPGPNEGLADPSKLGAVVATVRCSKSQHDSNRRTEPDWTDPGSTFVPDGSPLYELVGVPVACQVAARSNDGRLHLYTAMPESRSSTCPP